MSDVWLQVKYLKNSTWVWVMLCAWFKMSCFNIYTTINILVIEAASIRLAYSTVQLISQPVLDQIT